MRTCRPLADLRSHAAAYCSGRPDNVCPRCFPRELREIYASGGAIQS